MVNTPYAYHLDSTINILLYFIPYNYPSVAIHFCIHFDAFQSKLQILVHFTPSQKILNFGFVKPIKLQLYDVCIWNLIQWVFSIPASKIFFYIFIYFYNVAFHVRSLNILGISSVYAVRKDLILFSLQNKPVFPILLIKQFLLSPLICITTFHIYCVPLFTRVFSWFLLCSIAYLLPRQDHIVFIIKGLQFALISGQANLCSLLFMFHTCGCSWTM